MPNSEWIISSRKFKQAGDEERHLVGFDKIQGTILVRVLQRKRPKRCLYVCVCTENKKGQWKEGSLHTTVEANKCKLQGEMSGWKLRE